MYWTQIWFILHLISNGEEDNLKDLADIQKKIRISGGGLLVCLAFLLCISVFVMMDKQNLNKLPIS